MRIEYTGPYESVTVGRRELFVCEKGKATSVPDELGSQLIKRDKFRKASSSGSTNTEKE